MNENKARILTAASELFLGGGVSALSVRAIAKRAGLSTIGIYSHFEGKQGILDSLYIQGFEEVERQMDVLNEGQEPAEAVRLAARNYLNFAQQFEAHNRLIFGESDSQYEPSDEAKLVGIAAFEQFTRVTASLLPANASRHQQHDVALQFWALLHGGVSLRNHAIAGLVSMKSWQQRLMLAVDHLIDGVTAQTS